MKDIHIISFEISIIKKSTADNINEFRKRLFIEPYKVIPILITPNSTNTMAISVTKKTNISKKASIYSTSLSQQ